MLIVGIVCTTLLKSLDRLIDLVDGVEINGKVLFDSVDVQLIGGHGFRPIDSNLAGGDPALLQL